MKKISLDGRLGRDAEVKETSGGTKYVKFTLANTVFERGEEKTEWFDVTSYDPFVIEKQIKALTKGSYVILDGSLKTEGNVNNGKFYINQYVTAHSIDIPKIGGRKDDDSKSDETVVVSTYTAKSAPKSEPVKAEPKLEVKVEPVSTYTQSPIVEENDGDDLPF